MNPFGKTEDPRRRLLVKALTAGLISGGLPAAAAFAQSLFGRQPAKLPAGQSIYRIAGSALVNGRTATMQTSVRSGDTVETGKDSEIIFVVDGHSMLLRSESHLVIESSGNTAASLLIAGMRLLTGKLLSVSRNSHLKITTSTATIGIRGTGWYAESDPEQTYFCTCYGITDVASNEDSTRRETVVSEHHNRPLYIVGKGRTEDLIRNAPFINHTDQELMLIEALVGRTPPFVFPNDSYTGPRRDY